LAISLSYNNPPPPLSSQVGSIEWHLGEAVAAATDGPVQTLWARKAGKMVTGGGSSLKIWVERVPGVGDDAAAAAQPWLEAWDVQVRAPDPLDTNPTQGVREYERSFPGFQSLSVPVLFRIFKLRSFGTDAAKMFSWRQPAW
jgi:hypothetical protein